MEPKLVHIGFGNILAMNRVLVMISPGSAPTKRLIQDGKRRGMLTDMTNGRKTKAVIVMDSGHIILAAITPETIANRLAASHSSSSFKVENDEEEGE